MGKQTPAAPPAPDYIGAATAQGAANSAAAIQQGYLNNPNINSPYGNQTVTFGANNQPTVTQSLTPQAQQTLNAQQQTQTQLANLANQGAQMASGVLGKPFQFNGPQVQTSYGQPNSEPRPRGYAPPGYVVGPLDQLMTVAEAAQAYPGNGNNNAPRSGQSNYAGTGNQNQSQNQGGETGSNLATSLNLGGVANMPVNAGMTGQQAIMNRLEPSLARQRTSTETQLINQGLRPGSEAYDNAVNLLGQQENDARQQAVLQGINLDMGANQQGYGQALSSGQFGNAALAQQYNQGLQSAQFGNTAQQQALTQALQQYNLPVNMISALMSGSQIQNPQFQGYSGANVVPAPIANATAQQGAFNQNLYNQQVASANANNAGLYSLGSAAIGLSDRRLKSNIKRIGTHKLGIGIYEYDIMGKHDIGVMAQEVEKVMPEAISRHSSGYMMVDYGRINA